MSCRAIPYVLCLARFDEGIHFLGDSSASKIGKRQTSSAGTYTSWSLGSLNRYMWDAIRVKNSSNRRKNIKSWATCSSPNPLLSDSTTALLTYCRTCVYSMAFGVVAVGVRVKDSLFGWELPI